MCIIKNISPNGILRSLHEIKESYVLRIQKREMFPMSKLHVSIYLETRWKSEIKKQRKT